MHIKAKSSKLLEPEIEQLFTFQDYLNTSEKQFVNLLPKEVAILENLRRFIYNNCMKHAKTLAYNFATNACRNAGNLNDEEYNVVTQKYGALFCVDEYFRKHGLSEQFLKIGLEEKELAYIKELVAQTILHGYKTQPFTMTDKSSYSLSGYTSSSITSEMSDKFGDEDLITKINATVMNYFLQKSVKAGERINVLLDSTIVFTDGTSLTCNKETYSNTKGFGKGIKAIMLVTEQGFPLMFNVTAGNEPDVVTIPHILEKLELYCEVPKDQLTIVCDAGYFSKNNILYILSQGYDINVVGKDIKLTRELISKVTHAHLILAEKDESNEVYLPFEVPITEYITEDDIQCFCNNNKDLDVDAKKLKSQKLKIVLIYNFELQKDEFFRFSEKIRSFRKDLENSKDKTKFLNHPYITKHKYYTITITDDNQIKCVSNYDAINKRAERFGFNSIFSTLHDFSCNELVNIYRSRINIEVLFKKCKQSLGLDAVRVHKDNSLKLKMLITQISIGMINEMNNAFQASYQEDFPISSSEHTKLRKEYPTILNLIEYIHNDLSFEKVNNTICYKSMNKTTRIALDLFGFKNPIEEDFIKSTYSYKESNKLPKNSKKNK